MNAIVEHHHVRVGQDQKVFDGPREACPLCETFSMKGIDYRILSRQDVAYQRSQGRENLAREMEKNGVAAFVYATRAAGKKVHMFKDSVRGERYYCCQAW